MRKYAGDVKVGGRKNMVCSIYRRSQLPTLQIYSIGDRLMITEYRQNDTDRGNRSSRRKICLTAT